MSSNNWPQKVFNASTTELRGLVLEFDAFIHEAPPGVQTLSVVVSSESQSLIDSIEFNEIKTNNINVLKTEIVTTWGNSFSVWNTKYIMDIYVPTKTLEYVKVNGCGDAVVYPRTVTNRTTDTFQGHVSGSGSIFIQDDSLQLNQVSLGISGSGRIQWNVPQVTVSSKLGVSISGSGDVGIMTATMLTGEVDASISGSGNIYLQSTSSLNATTGIKSSISGSGEINYYEAGSCGNHNAKISGSGSIYAGAVRCQSTSSSISGSGSIYTNSASSLDASISGSGTVYAWGVFPQSVSGHVASTTTNKFSRYNSVNVPDHSPSRMFRFGLGLSIVLGIILVALISFLIKRFCNCCKGRGCCKRKAHTSEPTYCEVATPVVLVQPTQDMYSTKPYNNEAVAKNV